MKLVCNAALIVAVLAVGLIMLSNAWAAPGAEQAEPEAATAEDPLSPVADWLMARDNTRQRAAGIQYRLSMVGMTWSPNFESASLLERLEDAIADADDGASLSWLAGACASGIQEFCMDAGLDDAIVRYDGGNFFSRMALRKQPDADEVRRLLVESSVQRTYYPERVAVWHEALQHHDLQHPDGVNDLGFALLAGLMTMNGPLGPLHEACTTETDSASIWNHACERVAADMAENGRTATERMAGWSLLDKRAEALGDPIRAAEYSAELATFRNFLHCVGRLSSVVAGKLDAQGQREYVGWLIEHGEVGALERLAERNGLDCSDPPDARVEAMRRLRQLEAEGAGP